MSSMLSAPATMPATRAATFTSGFAPADPGTRTWVAARSCSPARPAKAITGTNPAHDTRFGSSKPAETVWQDRIYRMSFCLVRWNPQEIPSSQVKRTFVRHDALKTPRSTVDRGSEHDRAGRRCVAAHLGVGGGQQRRVGTLEARRPADALQHDEPQQVATSLLVPLHGRIQLLPPVPAVGHRQTEGDEH